MIQREDTQEEFPGLDHILIHTAHHHIDQLMFMLHLLHMSMLHLYIILMAIIIIQVLVMYMLEEYCLRYAF